MMKISHGFTLIEIAVVLMIIGFLIGSLLAPASEQMIQQKIQVTQQRLEEIKETLIGYAIEQGELPCPALDNEGDSAGNCDDNTEGYLPWKTLGLDTRRDSWGHSFRYRVDEQYTTSFPNPPNTSSELVVQDRQNSSLTAPESGTVNSRVIAIIFSCGQNGLPDDENDDDDIPNSQATCINSQTPNNNIYVQDVYVESQYAENQFDDILIWLPKTILINRLVAAGQWPPF